MWCEVSADVRRLVVASLPFAAMRVARDVDCELRGLVDDDGMRMLARELGCVTDSAQGAAEGAAEGAAARMAEDAGGWHVALAELHGTIAAPTPTGSGIGRYLTALALGARGVWPAWPQWPTRSRSVWDCHPYDPGAPARARRVLVVVGDARTGINVLLKCMTRTLPLGMRAWSGRAEHCPRDGDDVVILRAGAIGTAIARLDAEVETVVVTMSLPTLAGWSAWVHHNATSVVRMGHRDGRMERGQLVCGPACGPAFLAVSCSSSVPRHAWGVQYRPGSERVRGLRADVASDDRLTCLLFLS